MTHDPYGRRRARARRVYDAAERTFFLLFALLVVAGLLWFVRIIHPTLVQAAPGSQEVALPPWLAGLELEPTYTGGAGLIFDRRCTGCHREGGLGPMSFESLAEIRRWSVGTQVPMRDAVALGLMPPWPPDPAVGAFANDPRPSAREVELLTAWIDAGYPRGEDRYDGWSDWSAAWDIGEPDAVFDLPEQAVPPHTQGMVVEHTVRTGFAEDRWVVAAEARPGDVRTVVTIDAGPLGAYRTMSAAVRHPEGTAMRLPAGAAVRVRVRYDNPTAEARADRSRLGVRFALGPGAGLEELRLAPMRGEPFTMEAGQAEDVVRVSFTFPADGRVHALHPTLHLRGRSVEYSATLPDGRVERLLSVPTWSPRWKFRYLLRTPLDAPAGTRVDAVAVFDNSLDNLYNPDPWSALDAERSGDVFEGWLTYSLR